MTALEFPKLNLYQMMVFFHVASENSITSAAEKLYLTQPTVSAHIKSLEKYTGLKLIEIKRKRVSLTPDGEALYQYCREIHNQALAAERYIKLHKESFIVAGVSPIFVSLVSRTISSMSDRLNPKIKLNLLFGGASADLVQSVVHSKIDIAIVPDSDYGFEGLNHIRISEGEKLAFYASANHPIFKKNSLEWKDLCDYPVVMGQDAYLIQNALKDKLSHEGLQIPLKLDFTTNNVECCKILVNDGKSISMSLMEDIDYEVKSGKLKVLSLPDEFLLNVEAVINRDSVTSPVIQDFIACLKMSFRNHRS